MQLRKIIVKEYSQKILLTKINQYLKGQGLDLIDEIGYCHGLALLWLQKMAERNEKWFYDTVRSFVNTSDDKLKETNLDFEKFIAKIEYAQWPTTHTHKIFNNTSEIIYQQDINKILEIRTQINRDGDYSAKDLIALISEIKNQTNSIVLTGGGVTRLHTVAGFYRDNTYYFFDANLEDGKAIELENSREIAKWVQGRLFTHFNQPVPDKMDLQVKLLHSTCALKIKRKADHLHQPVAKRQKKSPQSQTLFSSKMPAKIAPNTSPKIKKNNSFSM